MTEIKTKSYDLRTPEGSWLGQIILSTDGMFASVTDWGNLSFAWRRTGHEDFRHFLLSLSVDYFGKKMYQGNTYIISTKKCEEACMRFSENILPALKEALKEDVKNNPNW